MSQVCAYCEDMRKDGGIWTIVLAFHEQDQVGDVAVALEERVDVGGEEDTTGINYDLIHCRFEASS